MDKIANLKVEEVFQNHPDPMWQKLMFLRHLVLETASEIEGVNKLQETLKWGEPSYLTKKGSTIRLGWKESKPNHYAMYFNCKTKLVATVMV